MEEITELWVKTLSLFHSFAKPNIGERGYRVEKIHNETELIHYLQDNENDFIIQEYVNFPVELGIFMFDNPDIYGESYICNTKGFMTVHGDGYSTIRELMEKKMIALAFRLKECQEN